MPVPENIKKLLLGCLFAVSPTMIPPLREWSYNPADRLGGGGYAQVYGVRHPGRSTGEYAVKVLDNPFYANTFEQEVRMLRALEGCPHTPALVDFGRDAAGRLCIVTQRASGMRLDRHVRRHGPLSPARTMKLIEQVIEVLSFAHERDIVHKDIKASNILMDGDRFTVLDWGVSRFRGDGKHETIRAKQDYTAPECYWGRQDFATDFYSLGWLAVYVSSGELPYEFADVRDAGYRVAAHCLERPRIPSTVAGPLCKLVACWLQKNPQRRLVGYDLSAMLDHAQTLEVDAFEGMTFDQLRHECGFLHRAARHGVPYAQHEFAKGLIEAGRNREAVFWLRSAADNGYGRAMHRLSQYLRETDPAQSREWLEKAAAAAHSGARYRLAVSFLESPDASRHREHALTLLRLAAEAGHGLAQYALSQYLPQTPEAAREARAWLYRAADRGEAPPYLHVETSHDTSSGTGPFASSHAHRHIVEANTVTELDAHGDAWDKLVQQCPAAYPSQTFGWLRAFYANKLKPQERMVCLLAYWQKTLVGVLPLVSGHRLFDLGSSEHHYKAPYHDYHTVRVDTLALPGYEAVLEAFVEYLRQSRSKPPILRFRKVPETSPTLICCRHPGTSLGLLERLSGEEHRTHLPGDYAAYLAGLDGKFRRELHRQARRLEERATVRYRLRENSRPVEENLARFMEVENSGWKGKKNTSIEAIPGDPSLYLAAAEHFAAGGWMEWNFLEADGETIAGQFAVRLNHTLFLWKVGYREEYAGCAPSHLLFARTVENACRMGDVHTVNFMARRTWLRVWNVTPHPLYNLIVFPRDMQFAPLVETAASRGYALK